MLPSRVTASVPSIQRGRDSPVASSGSSRPEALLGGEPQRRGDGVGGRQEREHQQHRRQERVDQAALPGRPEELLEGRVAPGQVLDALGERAVDRPRVNSPTAQPMSEPRCVRRASPNGRSATGPRRPARAGGDQPGTHVPAPLHPHGETDEQRHGDHRDEQRPPGRVGAVACVACDQPIGESHDESVVLHVAGAPDDVRHPEQSERGAGRAAGVA